MFDLERYLAELPDDTVRMLQSSEGRRVLTRLDPRLFALVYLPHHLKDETGQITFSEFHDDIVKHAVKWVKPDVRPRQHRDCYVAPRNCGKSTWFFTILPIWAAAHGHRQFIAAFSDSATQAEMHLQTFRRELEQNDTLRRDFPDLCNPARKARGTAESDNVAMYIARSGFVFAARGVDSRTLGMKVGTRRPDLLILDDIEPPEENYSADLKQKRLGALLDSILPLNESARVVIVGTVTMPDSIIHDLVRSVTEPGDIPDWITVQNIRTHYYPALITDEQTGEERSIWPAKWSLAFLQSIRRTREFLKNFMNNPLGRDGAYWTAQDFRYGSLPALTACVLSIDPAVTSKKKSDFTALSVVGAQAAGYDMVNGRRTMVRPARAVVRYAVARRIKVGTQLRDWVLAVLDQFPEIAGVIIETNQGGGKDDPGVWSNILHDLPVRILTVHQSIPKEVRAARLLNLYQRDLVWHEQPLPAAEAQMVGFPNAPHDDLVDSVGAGVSAVMPKNKPRSHEGSYG